MPIKKDQALTPNKKQALVDEIQQELLLLTNAIKEKKYNEGAYILLQQNKQNLQGTLNKVLDKKGIITPSETSKALDQINQAKRARLEKDYVFGLRKGTFFILSLIVIGISGYMIIKKQK